MSTDLRPTGLRVYGYGVAWIPPGNTTWTIEPDDDYRNLPAHYGTLADAADRAAFLQDRGFRARAIALLAMPDDTATSLGDVSLGPPKNE